jgi:PleD family two-component response regulator
LIDEASPQPGFVAMQQTLARLQQSNRELQQTVAELEQVASTDKLTGAWNRHRLEEGVRSEMDRLNRYQHPLSLLVLDIDCFKPINDQHGHADWRRRSEAPDDAAAGKAAQRGFAGPLGR